MKINESKQILRLYKLKLTSPRVKLLEIFLANDTALTYAELLRLADEAIDRVSIYRTLKIFEDAGIIHRIVGATISPSYALSHLGEPEKESNHPQHLHFSCIKCNCVYCLDDQLVPPVSLPDIYKVHSLSMIVIGICRICNEEPD
jgi:Fur family ferric uptake transcriptional regulator